MGVGERLVSRCQEADSPVGGLWSGVAGVIIGEEQQFALKCISGNLKCFQAMFLFNETIPYPLLLSISVNLGTLILVSLIVLTLRAPNQGGNFHLIVVLTLRTANQGDNFQNIVVFTQIRGVIRSLWGHNKKKHFSFGFQNMLLDPPTTTTTQNVPKF